MTCACPGHLQIFLLSGSLTRSYITTPDITGSCNKWPQHGLQNELKQMAGVGLVCYVWRTAIIAAA